MLTRLYKLLIPVVFLFFSISGRAQLTVTSGQPAAVLAGILAGPGTTVLNPVLTCPAVANGAFINGPLSTSVIAMNNGILLTNGHAAACSGPEGPLVSFTNGTAGDPSMAPFLPAGTSTFDACILEMDVVAKSDTISFNYQFGSEEYRNAVCSIYTDVFAFFISGPGITGTPNMALVPGTNIPVEINSVNNGTPGSVGGARLSNCTALGAGSPFTAYYINNTGGAYLSYRGYTTKFRAYHAVTPCDTYHLKMSVVDAGNAQYDSGVWLEGGSLVTNTYSFNHTLSIGDTINGTPNSIVKGCTSASVTIDAGFANSVPDTLHLAFAGTAVNGVDVSAIPSSIVFPAGRTSVSFSVTGIPTPPAGSKTLTIYLLGACNIADSISMTILDTPTASILTPDTSVCSGQSFTIRTTGSPGLSYIWAPPTGLSSTTAMDPVVTATGNVTYTMTATYPGSGCPPIVRAVSVTMATISVNMITPDTSICPGSSVLLRVAGNSSNTYSWSPVTGLNSPGVQTPLASPLVTTTYTLTATTLGGGCSTTDSVTISVYNINANIITPDTSICTGQSFQVDVAGTSGLTYVWTPAAGLDNPAVMEPVLSPTISTRYMVVASLPGTPCIDTQSVNVIVESVIAHAGDYPVVCIGSSIQLEGSPSGDGYSYMWQGPEFTSLSRSPMVLIDAASVGIYTLTVTNSMGCVGTDTTMLNAEIVPAPLLNVTPSQTIPYGGSVQLNADNALFYRWSPDDGSLSNDNINNPVATPLANTTYTVYGTDKYGCLDSAQITINVIAGGIFIPDAFTPNGDGLNDVFKVGMLQYYTLDEMSIYNRWGQRVYFASHGENQGWNGTFNGAPQDMGVYNYLIIVNSPGGQQQSFKGSLTLIR